MALLVYGATAGGSLATTDAVVTFDVTRNICEHGTLAMSGNLLGMEVHRGVDGRYYSPFGIAQSVYNIPFYLAGRAAQRSLGVRFGKADSVTKAAVALGGTVAAAACVALTFLLALEVSGLVPVGLGAAGLFAFATVFWPYAKFGFNVPLATCCLLAGTLAVRAGVRRRTGTMMAAAGLCFGAGMLTRHELGVVVLPVTVYLVLLVRRSFVTWRHVFAVAGGFAVGFATWMLVNAVRFGNPFNPGYLGDPIPGFGTSIVGGLYGLLLSPAGSLFLYCPVMLLALPAFVDWWKRDRQAVVLFGGMFLTLLLFYSQLANWAGGRSYGPRYLVPTLPFLVIGTAWWLHRLRGRGRRLALAVCAVSVLVQLPGVAVDFSKVSVAWARQQGPGMARDRLNRWSASPLLLNTRATLDALPRNARYLAGIESPPSAARTASETDREVSQQFAFSLDFWWLYLFYLGAWRAGAALREMAYAR